MKKIYFLIGHRGVGKTKFLEQLKRTDAKNEVSDRLYFDLDQEIEKAGTKISDVFASQGEEAFRKLEFESLAGLLTDLPTDKSAVIVLGAGFRMKEWRQSFVSSQFTHQSEWVWLCRISDERGRIFLDRPRLNQELSPLDEYELRFQQREPIFSGVADFILELPEGESEWSDRHLNRLFWAAEFEPISDKDGGIYTLTSNSRPHFHTLKPRLMNSGFAAFELRTDLMPPEDILFWSQNLPIEKQLLSYRGTNFPKEIDLHHVSDVDWALEFGKPLIPASILSLHDSHNLSLFDGYEMTHHLKFSPQIETYADLLRGFEWQQKDPKRRSFLPRSTERKWTWCRLFAKGRQRLNFIRMGAAAVGDQPTMTEWQMVLPNAPFAAVLGNPVWQSHTPSEQGEFFADVMGLSCLRITIGEEEWDEAFPVLEKMGLRAAAVTSPLKKKAAVIRGSVLSEKARVLETANTLVLRDDQKWHAHNTDEGGFRETAELHQSSAPTVVWGGGGTLSMLKSVWPSASFYSVRSGLPRENEKPVSEPKVLIWAAGPKDPAPQQISSKGLELVIDLNYREDSLAREYALKTGAKYVSGLEFFKAQARLQREFWRQP